MSLIDLPRTAVEAFETATKLHVTIHALDRGLWTMLPPARASHTTPVCMAAKRIDEGKCIAFDQAALRAELERRPEGFVKVCHAGLVECVVPVLSSDGRRQPRLVLFAGQGRAGAGLNQTQPLRTPSKLAHLLLIDLPTLPVLDAASAQVHLELLRQLAARFEQWLAIMEGQTPQGDLRKLTDRRQWIQHYILTRHTQAITIDDMAAGLNVSPSRAAHLTRQACGESFGKLLATARVRTAASLLTHTDLPILDIALRSGFGDVSNFHRRFRQHLKTTPLQHRRKTQQISALMVSV